MAMKTLLRAACVLAAMGVLAAGPAPAQDRPKKIIFIAGPKQHGAPGRHEYERDLRELAWSLEHATNLKGVVTQVIIGRVPKDLSVLADADEIVMDGNGDWLKTETGLIFPQMADTDGLHYDAETTAWLKSLDALIKEKHIGLTIFHYSMWTDNRAGRTQFLDWFGGLWIPYASHNPVDTWSVRPMNVRHPILNGVTPWTYREEMYSRYFLFDNPGRTELLEAKPSDPKNGLVYDPVSWAYVRPDGGRSFVWGGADFHDNLHSIESYRRYLLNGIAWTAGLEVPRGGVSAPPQPEM
jgi:hypothetical protein